MPTQIVITGDTLVYDGSSFNDTYLNAIDNITATIAADPMVQQVTGIPGRTENGSTTTI